MVAGSSAGRPPGLAQATGRVTGSAGTPASTGAPEWFGGCGRGGGGGAGLAIVDCRHDGVVEHIRVDVDPEVVGGVRTGEVGERAFGGGARAGRADRGEIECKERLGKRLAAVAGLFLRVAEADDDRVLG